MNRKAVAQIQAAPAMHWVGDGFPVRSMFSYQRGTEAYSPFLLLDYAAPSVFPPNPGPHRRGVGVHPHRGFETVTIVYAGEVAHRDSVGNSGVIGPGSVQWMTAAGGILHEEFHSESYSRSGGPFQMVQLWVNLPAKHKFDAPGYQELLQEAIPTIDSATRARVSAATHAPANAHGGAQVRVIAGEYAGVRGPARTHTPMNVWNVQLAAGQSIELVQPEGWTCVLMVVAGEVTVNHAQTAKEAELVMMERRGETFTLSSSSGGAVLLLAGEPIDEPIVGYGPFVMNTRQEINDAINDFNAGKFGQM